MGRDDPQFNLRLPYELKEKVKQRAAANGRSLNAELIQIVQDAMSKPSPVMGYRDEEERIASLIADQVKEVAAEIIRKEKTRR